jgi:chloramphenicol 3-O phosphotransferase
MSNFGRVVVLNGTPRSGKSSIAAAMQASSDGVWLNLGVDAFAAVTPERLRPGIGLRPGGERPDLEPSVTVLYSALYEAVAALCRARFDVVVDVGHHDGYSVPLGILGRAAEQLRDLPAYFVGVHCPIDVIMERRGQPGTAPEPVLRWQRAVHVPGIYDVEVDTSQLTPDQCAAAISRRIGVGPPTAFGRIAEAPPQS